MDSQKKLYVKPRGFTEPHNISGLPPNTPLLVAFSGGSDSGALLDMTVRYAERVGAKVCAAHVNHGIRGKEADRDEEFCRRAAERYGIEIFVLRADVPAIAAAEGKSVETAARDVRYAYFANVMKKNNIPLLCVAHNADDNLETIIFNVARGSGLSGVCGIPRTRDFEGGTIIRPILEMSKDDINKYCSENNIEYVTDSTNTDTDYTRNRIRGLIIPELKAICPRAEAAAARLSESLREDALCLDSMANWFVEETRNGFAIEAEKLNGSPYAISSRAVMSLYCDISEGRTLEHVHVKAILELSRRCEPHSSLDLPCGVRAVIENGSLCFTKAPPPPKNSELTAFSVSLCEGVNDISEINAQITLNNTENAKNIYKTSINLSVDSAKIVGNLYVRERQAKDKIKINSMSRSIKKLMCDKKIPREIRPRIPMICDDSGIVAVPLIGVRDSYSPSKDTKNIIYIELNLL